LKIHEVGIWQKNIINYNKLEKCWYFTKSKVIL